MLFSRRLVTGALALASVAAMLVTGMLTSPVSAAEAGTAPAVNSPGLAAQLPRLLNSPAKPTATTASGIPIWHITSAELIGHTCRALGNYGTNQGVECADILAGPGATAGTVDIWPVAEAYCENLANRSFEPQCANAVMIMTLNSPLQHTINGVAIMACGHANGPCAVNNRNYLIGNEYTVSGCNTNAGGPNEFWSVIQTDSSVQLPGSDKTVTSTSNLASSHAIICP